MMMVVLSGFMGLVPPLSGPKATPRLSMGRLSDRISQQGRGVGARPHGSQRCLKVCTAHALRLQALLERCQRCLAADGLDGKRVAKPVSLAAPRDRFQGGTAGPTRLQLCSGAQGAPAQVRGGLGPQVRGGIYVAARTPRLSLLGGSELGT